MYDLTLEIGEINIVAVTDGDASDTRRGEVERDRRAESAGADDERMRGDQLLLALDADLGQQNVTAVAQQLLVVHGGEA